MRKTGSTGRDGRGEHYFFLSAAGFFSASLPAAAGAALSAAFAAGAFSAPLAAAALSPALSGAAPSPSPSSFFSLIISASPGPVAAASAAAASSASVIGAATAKTGALLSPRN